MELSGRASEEGNYIYCPLYRHSIIIKRKAAVFHNYILRPKKLFQGVIKVVKGTDVN